MNKIRPVYIPNNETSVKGGGGSYIWAIVLLALLMLLSSCSYNLSPTTAQMEQKKFERFKISPKEALIYSGSTFVGYGLGKHFANIKLKD